MKIQFRFFYGILSILFFFIVSSSFTNTSFNFISDFTKINYKIRPASKLEVFGKTNVNSFCCTSSEKFKPQNLKYKFDQERATIHFENAEFKIKVEQLNCGKKPINRDLYKALRTNEFPYIKIKMKEVFNLECDDLIDCDKWVEFEANADITITCETQSIRIPLLVKKMDTQSMRISGGTSLQLCDFDIQAPSALMGLIQVEDKIELSFDLLVDIEY